MTSMTSSVERTDLDFKISVALGQSLHCPHASIATHWVHREDPDQTGRMPRLIWVFAGRIVILLVLSWGGSYCFVDTNVSGCKCPSQPIMEKLGMFYTHRVYRGSVSGYTFLSTQCIMLSTLTGTWNTFKWKKNICSHDAFIKQDLVMWFWSPEIKKVYLETTYTKEVVQLVIQ